MNRETALVVFSGGQDSTTCLFWAKRNFKKVYALSFLYGQKHQKEVELAREIARKAEVEFDVMDVSFIGTLGHNSLTDTTMVMDQEKPAGSVPNTFVPGRNLFFLSIAAVYARERGINHLLKQRLPHSSPAPSRTRHLCPRRWQRRKGYWRCPLPGRAKAMCRWPG